MTDKAQKLLRLALDAGAMDGEWRNAAVMFVASLRKAGTTAESFTARTPENRRPEPTPWTPPAATMPFGKYKARGLDTIPADYLEWLLENCELRPALKRAVEAELHRRP
jgi:hypothetical protein